MEDFRRGSLAKGEKAVQYANARSHRDKAKQKARQRTVLSRMDAACAALASRRPVGAAVSALPRSGARVRPPTRAHG